MMVNINLLLPWDVALVAGEGPRVAAAEAQFAAWRSEMMGV